jgi:N-acetylmuramoyl-L-alanine amidase
MLKRTRVSLTAEVAKHAKKIVFLCVLSVLCGFFRVVVVAAPPAKSMYEDAMAREQKSRADLNSPDATPTVLGEVHAVVAAYESLVQHYPGSGYSDNALWQAGRLSLDAFVRFGQPSDKDAGMRLLKKLATTYPTSKLAKQVPEQIVKAIPPPERVSEDAIRMTGADADAAPPSSVATPQSAAPPKPGVPASAGARRPPAPADATASPRSSLATIKGIRRSVLPDAVRIIIELDGEVPFHEERIQDPERVFVDLPGTRAVTTLVDQTIRFESDGDIVRQVRVGRHPNNTTRVVLDAAGVTSYSVYPLYTPYRLVIDCVRVPAAVTAAAVTDKVQTRVPAPAASQSPQNNDLAAPAVARPLAPLRARTMTNPWLRHLPGSSPRAASLIALARQTAEPAVAAPVEPIAASDAPPPSIEKALPPPTEKVAESAPAAPPAHNARGGLSMARQLGLGVSRIVIDPGHGGHDPGAQGKGVTEAELVLDVALRLEKLLSKLSGVEVILTRRSDEFIPLPERTAIANREGADLFLSIHANASTNGQAHGIETYFLNFANNQSAAAVAARENAASTQAMGGLPDFVKAIALNNKLDESRDFAFHVQRAMVERQRTVNKLVKDLGVKQAPFVVLIGANMPSVLAETGFVTNPQEGKLLKGNAYRQKIAESLFNAIRKYQTSLKNVSTDAMQ